MNLALIFVAMFCFLAGAASLYRSKNLPPDKKVGQWGVYIDKTGYRWQGALVLILGLIVLIMGFLI